MDPTSNLLKSLDEALAPKKSPSTVRFLMDPLPKEDVPAMEGEPTLAKSLTHFLNGPKDSIWRLAFETDPQIVNNYQSVYRAKTKLLPDGLIKRILIQDDLCAAIVRARETQMSSFGRPRPDRFSTGYVIEPNAGVAEKLTPDQRDELDTRIQLAVQKFWTCGNTENVPAKERLSFAQWLQLSTRNMVGLGRLATEIVYSNQMEGGRTFSHFRPVDAGTIYKATPQKSAAQSIREQAIKMLKDIKGLALETNTNIDEKRFENDEYSWIQVIDARPVQAFTDDEMRVHNFYQVVDVELDGYPVTPIDTMISAVTTHINITTHNKLYFQTGRASRGMIIFKSDDVTHETLQNVKQQFNASINSVNNAWRMPVFSCGPQEDIVWESIDNSSRDAEFQYLTDMNARVILSAFQMSPDELAGWAYLSRGTNNQSLSESNNEYRLEASRDQGIRPLLASFEDFINGVLFPLIDPHLAKLCRLKLVGMDAMTEEKESVALQTNIPIHMTQNEVMRKVEKQPLPRKFAGDFLLNPQWQAQIDKYCYVDDIRVNFLGEKPDPSFRYVRDPFWFQWQQLQMQAQQMQQQAAAAQQQAQQPQQPGGGGDDGGGGGDDQQQQQPGEDFARSIDQAIHILSKTEKTLPASTRKLLTQHRLTVDRIKADLEKDLAEVTREILEEADKHRRS